MRIIAIILHMCDLVIYIAVVSDIFIVSIVYYARHQM